MKRREICIFQKTPVSKKHISESAYLKNHKSQKRQKTPISKNANLTKRLSQKPLVIDVMSQVSAAWKETDKLGSSVNYDAESIASTGTYLQGSKGIRQWLIDL